MTLPITRLSLTSLAAAAALNGVAVAQDFLNDQAQVQALLSGAILTGTYLRTNSPYELEFRADGSLVNQRGESARWWVNDSGQYCREWIDGRLAGNEACMKITHDDNRISIYSGGRKVAEGELNRQAKR